MDLRHADMQRYLSWRADTAVLLYNPRTVSDSNDFAWWFVDYMRSRLPQELLTKRDRADFRAHLMSISLRAIELASIFARSKALYRIIVTPPLLREAGSGPLVARFNEGEMEMTDQRGEGRDVVELTTRPGLTRAGDAEGNNYDQVSTLVKAGVCC